MHFMCMFTSRAETIVKQSLDKVMKGDEVLEFSGLGHFEKVIFVGLKPGIPRDKICTLAGQRETLSNSDKIHVVDFLFSLSN